MPEDLLHNPGVSPFERIVAAAEYDYEVCGRLVWEQGAALSGGLSGSSGRMTDGELRNAALALATTTLAICSMLGVTQPLAAAREYGTAVAENLEGKVAAA